MLQIKTYDFEQNIDEACVYKYNKEELVVFLVLYVDDILPIGNNVETLSNVRKWLAESSKWKIWARWAMFWESKS